MPLLVSTLPTASSSGGRCGHLGAFSLIRKVGVNYDDRLVGFIKGNRRVFYQGRGTPEYPGRTVTSEPADGEVCVIYLTNQ